MRVSLVALKIIEAVSQLRRFFLLKKVVILASILYIYLVISHI
ncbi:hypothetical protein SAMN05444408_1031, partial [Chryseobacterium takakiae]